MEDDSLFSSSGPTPAAESTNDKSVAAFESVTLGSTAAAASAGTTEDSPGSGVATFEDDSFKLEYSTETYEEKPGAIRSRMKGDWFHPLDAIPIPRNCPIAVTIYMLLIEATCIKNKEEDDNV